MSAISWNVIFKTDVSVEQRQVQIFPSIKTGGKLNVKFFDQLNDYFSDNFAFRQNLIEADAIIKKNVFRQSGNEKVIVGSKGYLFFSETLDDYLGQNTLSKEKSIPVEEFYLYCRKMWNRTTDSFYL